MGSGRFIAGVVFRPVTTAMVTITILLFGLVAAMRLPVDLLPDLSYPSITVRTEYADAAPEEIEELVTRPTEELVGAVPGVIAVESVSREGVSEVVLDFAWGTRIDTAMADVREKLDRVRLPLNSDRPVVLRYDPAQEPIMRLALTAPADSVEHGDEGGEGGHTTLSRLRMQADKQVKRELEKLPGVAAVSLHGGDEDEVRVELDTGRLAALGVSAQEVVDAINGDNINRPAGALTQNDRRYLIRTVNEARTPADIGAIAVRTTPDGAELLVRDVATVVRVPIERTELSLVDGREAIELAVYREGDANTVAVAQQVRDRLQSFELTNGQRIAVLSDQALFIERAVDEVIQNVLIGGVLAICVLLFFLRDLRSTVVIAVAIPVSLLAAFVPLHALGVSLNLMSLGGLALGVGMLVDNSIVVLEAIARVSEEQPTLGRRRAAVVGATEIASSVVASTLTTVAVFFPMAFLVGVSGQLVRDLAFAVSFSIISSMLVSLTVVPVMQAMGDTDADPDADPDPDPDAEGAKPRRRTPLAWLFVIPALLWRAGTAVVNLLGTVLSVVSYPLTRAYEALESAYPSSLRLALRLRALVLVAAVGLCAGTVIIAQGLGQTLIPEVRQGEFFVQLQLPQGTSLEYTSGVTRRLAAVVEDDDRVELVFGRVGSVTQGGSASGSQLGTHLAQINVRLVAEANDEDGVNEAELFEKLSAAAGGGIDLKLGRPSLFSFEAPIEIRVFADETGVAIAHARELLPDLVAIDALEDVIPDDLSGRPEVDVSFDRERLGMLGLSVDEAAAAVQRAVQGELATQQLHQREEQLDVRVQLPRVDRSRVEDVGRIVVGLAGESGQVPVRLDSVAEIEATTGPAEIRRIDGRRGLRIQARVGATDLGSVAEEVQRVLDEHAPSDLAARRGGLATQIAGQASEMEDSLRSMIFTALISVFLVYVVMASSFESLHHPFLIMFTVPLAIVGVVLAVAVTGLSISAMVGIGGIILGGIVVNNAIVLINAVNARRGRGLEVDEALVEGARTRVRPILMTTATTVLGLLPMAIGFGEGAALRQPLAVSVIGGLTVSTLLTLYVIPCAYSLVPGRKRDAWADAND